MLSFRSADCNLLSKCHSPLTGPDLQFKNPSLELALVEFSVTAANGALCCQLYYMQFQE